MNGYASEYIWKVHMCKFPAKYAMSSNRGDGTISPEGPDQSAACMGLHAVCQTGKVKYRQSMMINHDCLHNAVVHLLSLLVTQWI